MKREETIRLVWSRREGNANELAKAGEEAETEAGTQRRPLSRSRRLWGREDGFTLSARP